MRRVTLPTTALLPWCLLNGVTLDGVTIREIGNGQGSGIVATRDSDVEDTIFVNVPRELVLCQELVREMAKSDLHLRQVLEASGDLGKTARGAIIVFLLVQLTATSPDVHDKIGLPNPFTDYIKFLPDERSLPSRWSESELICLNGTTLENHIKVKMTSLERQFDELRENTTDIPWCKTWWWSEEQGVMTLEDFKIVDSMFRSRAMDFGEHGLSLVPVMDMANHDSGMNYVARFEIEEHTRGGLLPLQRERYVNRGYEITINYGGDRSASDMLHSYGFIEPGMENAGTMFVSLPSFDDDPLAKAKQVGLELVPGVKFGVDSSGKVSFHSPCLWAMVVNEEDGLRVEFAQTHDGGCELEFFFQDKLVKSGDELQEALQEDTLSDLFELRAHQVLVELLDDRIRRHWQYKKLPLELRKPEGVEVESHAWKMSKKLRKLEYRLLKLVVSQLRSQAQRLTESNVVRKWLAGDLQSDESEQYNPPPMRNHQGPLSTDGAMDFQLHDDQGDASQAQWKSDESTVHEDWAYTTVDAADDVAEAQTAIETISLDRRLDQSEYPDSPAESRSSTESAREVDASAQTTTDSDIDRKLEVHSNLEGQDSPKPPLIYLGRMRFDQTNRAQMNEALVQSNVQELSHASESRSKVLSLTAEVEEEDDFS